MFCLHADSYRLCEHTKTQSIELCIAIRASTIYRQLAGMQIYKPTPARAYTFVTVRVPLPEKDWRLFRFQFLYLCVVMHYPGRNSVLYYRLLLRFCRTR